MPQRPTRTFQLITLAVLALCSPLSAAERLNFQVYLGDKPIGAHSFRITENGEYKRVSSQAAFDVDFLFINAYRYRHDSREVFRNGCLQEIRATTDDNGKKYRVKGDARGKEFRIENQDGAEHGSGCLMTFAYWDPDFLDQTRLLNAQTGVIEPVSVHGKGTERVSVGNREVSAKRYTLSTEKLTIDLWYNDDLGWVGLSSETGRGRRLVYRRM